jgi:Transposase
MAVQSGSFGVPGGLSARLPLSGHETALKADVRVRTYGPLTGTGAFWENAGWAGRPSRVGFEPELSVAAPATRPVVLEARIRLCRSPTGSPPPQAKEDQVREIGLDVHRDFCEVAIFEAGEVRSAPRIKTTPEELELFARSLGHDDRVALEVTGNAWEVARIIEPHVARVLIVSPSDTGIRQARAKTDRLDARTIAKLLASGSLEGLWMPDGPTRAAAPAAGAPQPAGAGPHPSQERDPRGADAAADHKARRQ